MATEHGAARAMNGMSSADNDVLLNMTSGRVLELVRHVETHMRIRFDPMTEGAPSKPCRMAIAVIAARFGGPLRLDDIARAAGMSKFHFLRRFTREIGVTPGAFLQHFRITRAMQLLDETNRPIRDIGRLVGYADPAAFSRAFLKLAGVQPYRFRRLRRQRARLVAEEGAAYGTERA
jgi:transcriptional regulator GlxA family with amidase domain